MLAHTGLTLAKSCAVESSWLALQLPVRIAVKIKPCVLLFRVVSDQIIKKAAVRITSEGIFHATFQVWRGP